MDYQNTNKEAPKKILSLDGGGIRGILSLGILKKLEDLFRATPGSENKTLGDYYDLIGGTSTGAIIACGLAVGKSVDEITQLYLNLGKEIFGKGRKMKWLKRSWKISRSFFKENYSSKRFEKYLQSVFGDIDLHDDKGQIKCGLAINSKRADTFSLWTMANHIDGRYYKANAHLKLWELCRASSAAPYYFKPKKLLLKTRKGESFYGTFIDGGVSLANNPAWQSFLVATEPSFGFGWQCGEDAISITSIGTGNGIVKDDATKMEKKIALMWASKLSDLFMIDALEMNQIILSSLGNNVGASYPSDSQFGDLSNIGYLQKQQKLFTYERHNVTLSDKGLEGLVTDIAKIDIKSLSEMDHYENMETLLAIGKAYAEKNINRLL